MDNFNPKQEFRPSTIGGFIPSRRECLEWNGRIDRWLESHGVPTQTGLQFGRNYAKSSNQNRSVQP